MPRANLNGSLSYVEPKVNNAALVVVSQHVILSGAKNLSFHFEMKAKRDSSLRSE